MSTDTRISELEAQVASLKTQLEEQQQLASLRDAPAAREQRVRDYDVRRLSVRPLRVNLPERETDSLIALKSFLLSLSFVISVTHCERAGSRHARHAARVPC